MMQETRSNRRNKVALITGIAGQDASYLSDLLLIKGYTVHGTLRHTNSSYFTSSSVKVHYADMTNMESLTRLIGEIRPDEVYNLAAQSSVSASFSFPEQCTDINGIGVLRLLDAIRLNGLENTCRFYQASSSELYGLTHEKAQNEATPFYPKSPYACSKLFAFWTTKNYREAYGMFAVNGILFNHESPRRGENYVTRKITQAAARILFGYQEYVELGNLDAMRDWGHAEDYIYAMWRMLQIDVPKDYVIATGETHSVRDFCNVAFEYIGMPLSWKGRGVEEYATDLSGKVRVKVSKQFFRPTDIGFQKGDASAAMRDLNWKPKRTFHALVEEMVQADIELLRESAEPKDLPKREA